MINEVTISDQMIDDAKQLFSLYDGANVISVWIEPNGEYDMNPVYDIGVLAAARGEYHGEYNPDWCNAAKIFFVREEDGNIFVMFPN